MKKILAILIIAIILISGIVVTDNVNVDAASSKGLEEPVAPATTETYEVNEEDAVPCPAAVVNGVYMEHPEEANTEEEYFVCYE